MEQTTSSSETRCKNPTCKRLLAQTGGGHRKREYCDDTCRQAARRHRKEQTHREEVDRRWATFTTETRGFLDWLTTRYSSGKDLADAVELAINREIDRSSAESSAQGGPALAALREKQLSRVEKLKARILQLEQEAEKPQPRVVLSAEQARERAGLHGSLDEGAYLASTQRLFVRVFQTGQIEPDQMREAIHQERGAETARLRRRVPNFSLAGWNRSGRSNGRARVPGVTFKIPRAIVIRSLKKKRLPSDLLKKDIDFYEGLHMRAVLSGTKSRFQGVKRVF